jgi:hypothetical protein
MELWKQATEHAFSVTTLNETPKEFEELKLAKFAELIVGECVDIAWPNINGFVIAKKIKEHFGVKS